MRAKLDVRVKDLRVKLVQACWLFLAKAVRVAMVKDSPYVLRAEKGKAVLLREAAKRSDPLLAEVFVQPKHLLESVEQLHLQL